MTPYEKMLYKTMEELPETLKRIENKIDTLEVIIEKQAAKTAKAKTTKPKS